MHQMVMAVVGLLDSLGKFLLLLFLAINLLLLAISEIHQPMKLELV